VSGKSFNKKKIAYLHHFSSKLDNFLLFESRGVTLFLFLFIIKNKDKENLYIYFLKNKDKDKIKK
jgi:hypothetical protein